MGFAITRINSIPLGWVKRYPVRFAVFGFFLYFLLLSPLTTRWVDFPVYWAAGRKALEGHTVYDVVGHFQYKYSPLIALLFGLVFKLSSYEQASLIFQKTMVLLWTFLFWRFSGRRFEILLPLLLFFVNALKLDLALGQVNALVIFAMFRLFEILGKKDYEKNRVSSWGEDLGFAAIFSLAVQLKLFALILVPILVFRKEWRKLGLGLALTPAMSVLGVALFSGWDFAVAENQAWLRSLLASTDELLLNEQNVGFLGFFGKILGLGAAKLLWGAAGLGFLHFLRVNRANRAEWIRNWAFTGIAVFNPLVWSYWILFVAPLAAEVFSFHRFWRRFEPNRGPVVAFEGMGVLFTLVAFLSQHAKWAWNWGIFVGMIYFVDAAFRRSPRIGATQSNEGYSSP